ncbi:MAG: undecaprenyl-phosphate glucose phosphotransferase [Myxococcales bacterium]
MVSNGTVVSTERSNAAWLMRLLDACLIGFAHYLASLLREEDPGADLYLVVATLVAAVIFNVIGDANGLYRPNLRSAFGKVEIGKIWTSWALTPPLLLTVAFTFKISDSYSRAVTLVWFILAPVILSVVRYATRRVNGELSRRGVATRSVHIVGATKMGALIAQRIMDDPTSGLRVQGFFDDRDPERLHPMPKGLGECMGKLDGLLELARKGQVDIVYVALPLRAESRISEIVRRLADSTASVYVVADFLVFDLVHAQWSNVQGLPVVSVFESPFYGVNGWLKRFEDIVLGSLIMLLISPAMALIALGVKLSSAGPVFFRQRRYGLNGEEIRVLKFRTMTVLEDGPEVKQAVKGDQRITRFGAFLRRTSLDELPQFINVLSGEMSIVGPRPHAVAHNEMYRRMIHGYMLRHKVKPGITGWAQVNGWRGETDTLEKMEQRINHDLHYIQNWGLLFDIKIIVKTVVGTGTRQNAY